MNTKNLSLATLGGGIAFFLLGYLFYVVLFGGMMESHMLIDQSTLMKDPPEFGAIIVGNLALALLFALIYERWAGIKTFGTGAQAGALIGGLFTLSYDLVEFGTARIFDFTMVVMDTVIFAVMAAIAGGVIGWILGRGNKK